MVRWGGVDVGDPAVFGGRFCLGNGTASFLAIALMANGLVDCW